MGFKYNVYLSANIPRVRLNVPGHVLVCERLQVRDCQASERQEKEEVTAPQLHCEHICASPRLVAATKRSQASAKSILLGGISGSYQDNILVLGLSWSPLFQNFFFESSHSLLLLLKPER